MIWHQERDDALLKLNDISLFGFMSTEEKLMSAPEFIDRIWNRIVDEIESRNR